MMCVVIIHVLKCLTNVTRILSCLMFNVCYRPYANLHDEDRTRH